jgi:hypothetical protein
VDHRPKLFLEGFLVEAWIGALECEGPNPGSCLSAKLSLKNWNREKREKARNAGIRAPVGRFRGIRGSMLFSFSG